MFVHDVQPASDITLSQSGAPNIVEASVISQARKWNEKIAPHYTRIWDVIRSYHADLSQVDTRQLGSELERILRSIQGHQGPPAVATARWHLLNTISDMMIAIDELIAGHENVAQAYFSAAKIELGFFDVELFQLGIS